MLHGPPSFAPYNKTTPASPFFTLNKPSVVLSERASERASTHARPLFSFFFSSSVPNNICVEPMTTCFINRVTGSSPTAASVIVIYYVGSGGITTVESVFIHYLNTTVYPPGVKYTTAVVLKHTPINIKKKNEVYRVIKKWSAATHIMNIITTLSNRCFFLLCVCVDACARVLTVTNATQTTSINSDYC